jgi:hypothetical protein
MSAGTSPTTRTITVEQLAAAVRLAFVDLEVREWTPKAIATRIFAALPEPSAPSKTEPYHCPGCTGSDYIGRPCRGRTAALPEPSTHKAQHHLAAENERLRTALEGLADWEQEGLADWNQTDIGDGIALLAAARAALKGDPE